MALTSPTSPASKPTPIPSEPPVEAGGKPASAKEPKQSPSPKAGPAQFGGLRDLREIGQRAKEAFGIGQAKFSNVNELASLDSATQVAILTEIRDGVPVDSARARLHQIVTAHLTAQLEADNEITPGIWATRFSHVRISRSQSGVIENGWEMGNMDAIKNDILNASIEYASKPSGTPPPNAFTFQQIVKKQPPTKDPSYVPTGPIHGVDGYGNQTMVMPIKHRSLSAITANIERSHPDTSALGADVMAWQRAAWLSALSHVSPDTIDQCADGPLDKKHEEAFTRIKALASAIQKENGAEKLKSAFTEAASSKDKQKAQLKYPVELGFTQHDCEADLRLLTGLLLKDVCNSDGKSILKAASQNPGVLVASLMNKLGANGVILDHTQSASGATEPSISISAAVCDMIGDDMPPESLTKVVDFYARYVPVVVISKDGIGLRAPLKTLEQFAAEQAQQQADSAGEPDQNGAPSADAAGAAANPASATSAEGKAAEQESAKKPAPATPSKAANQSSAAEEKTGA